MRYWPIVSTVALISLSLVSICAGIISQKEQEYLKKKLQEQDKRNASLERRYEIPKPTTQISSAKANDVAELLTRASRAMASKETERAIALLDQVIEAEPTNHEARDMRGKARLRLMRYSSALVDVLDRKTLTALDIRLHAQIGLFRYSAALETADAMIRLNPNAPVGHYYKAFTLIAMKRRKDARTAAERASNLASKDSFKQYGLIEVELGDGKYEKAINQIATLSAVFPAFVYLQSGEYENALNQIVMLLCGHESDPNAHDYHSRALHGKGDFKGAILAITRAITDDPMREEYYCRRARLHLKLGKKVEYHADAEQAVRLTQSPGALCLRGESRWKQKRYSLALADFDDAIRQFPESPDGARALAWFRATCPDASQRSGTEAVTFARRAVEMTKQLDESCLFALAAAYAECGEFKEAIKWQSQAMADRASFYPDDLKEVDAQLAAYKAGKPWRDTK